MYSKYSDCMQIQLEGIVFDMDGVFGLVCLVFVWHGTVGFVLV